MKTFIDRKILGFFAIIVMMGLAGCGGESSGGAEGGDTATGVFLDSAVEGLAYVSGSTSGLTNADGEFMYEVGRTVRFMVGDIVIGEALGKRLITPVDLIDGGDANHPTVLNIARFLQTIDEDNNPANGIRITEQVRNLAQGKSINFAQSTNAFSNDGNVQIVVSELTAVTSGGARDLVSSSAARAHLSNTIWGYYAGSYSGTFSGGDSGTWDVNFLANGLITGTGFSNNLGATFTISGSLRTDGTLTFATGDTSTAATYSGTLTNDFRLTGTWTGIGASGTFSGQQTGALDGDDGGDPPDSSITFSGSVSGTYTPDMAEYSSGGPDFLIIVWAGGTRTPSLTAPWTLTVSVPRQGTGAGTISLNPPGSLALRYECRNLVATGDCSGVNHNSTARIVTFADVVLVGPAVGDVVRLNGSLLY